MRRTVSALKIESGVLHFMLMSPSSPPKLPTTPALFELAKIASPHFRSSTREPGCILLNLGVLDLTHGSALDAEHPRQEVDDVDLVGFRDKHGNARGL
jgi:hypothetical protein